MSASATRPAVEELRARIQRLEGVAARRRIVLPFGFRHIDRHLPGGGLPLAALHEVAGGGNGAIDGAAAGIFAGGIAARTRGRVLWCVTLHIIVNVVRTAPRHEEWIGRLPSGPGCRLRGSPA